MPDVGSVKYVVELDNSKLDQDTGKTEKSISSKLDAISGKLSKSFGYQVLKDIGAAFIDMGKQAVSGFVEISKASLESRASLEQNIGGIETLFGAGGQSLEEYAAATNRTTTEAAEDYKMLMEAQETALNNAEKAYQTAGLSANEYMETATSVAAAMKQSTSSELEAAQAVDQMIVDMADNANKMGTDMSAIQTAYQGFSKQNYTMLDNLKLGYGGTKGEMERLIADANKVKEANGEMADLSIESFADVTEAIHIIQTEMGITGTTAAEGAATIEGSMNAAKAAYDNFLNGTISGEEFVEAALTAAQNIADNLAVLIQNFADQLPGMIDALAQRLPEMISTLGPPILDALGAIAESAVEIGSTLLDMLVQGAVQNAPAMSESAAAAIASLLNGISQHLPDVINSAMQIITAVTTGIANNLPQILAAAGNLIVTLVTGIAQALPQLTSAALQVVSALASYIIQNGPQILQKGVELIGMLVNGLLQSVGLVIGAAGKIIDQLKAAFSKVDWGSVGRNIITGIKNGIANAAHMLADAAKQAARKALDTAKEFLGIASPSKVFRDQVGEMIPAGMAEGIEDGETEVVQSMDRMLGAFTADVDYNLPSLSSYAQDLGASISANASTQITVPVEIDGREVARATAWYTNEQLAWETR